MVVPSWQGLDGRFVPCSPGGMCNLYSITKGQAAIREFTRAMRDSTGNLPSLPGVFPDYAAPVVRTAADGERELTMMRWGMPSPEFVLKGRTVDSGITNVRNVRSPHWRRWLGPANRCLVPSPASRNTRRQPRARRCRCGLPQMRADR